MKRKTIYSLIFAVLLMTSVATIGYVKSAAAIRTYDPKTSNSGDVLSDGSYIGLGPPHYVAGDNTSKKGIRCFFTFDISDISSGVNVDSVKLDLTDNSVFGDPFGDLGTMYVDGLNYGNTLDKTDYSLIGVLIATYSSAPAVAMEKPTLKTYVENAVSSGAGKVQFRVRFYKKTDNDTSYDRIVFNTAKLTIAFSTPPLTPSPTFTFFPTYTVVPLFFPDLTISDIFTNSSGNIAFKIANIGNTDVSSATMKIKVYKNGVLIFSSDVMLSIPAEGTLTLNLTGSSAKVTGTDEVRVVVDADDDIAELNNDNNERTEILVESGTPPPTTATPTTAAPTTAAPTTSAPTAAPTGLFTVSKPEYMQGEAVEIYLESTGTTPIRLSNTAPWTVYKVEGGLFEVFKPIAAEMIAEVTDQTTWIWNQEDNIGEPVPEGQYKIVLRTLNAGEYSATFVIGGGATTMPPTVQPTTQPQTTSAPTTEAPASFLENPMVLIGGAIVLLLIVLVIIIAMKK
jgi:hypothetical protein